MHLRATSYIHSIDDGILPRLSSEYFNGLLAGLPKAEFVEGRDLKPLLEKPTAGWSYPAITTYRQNNHAVRSQRYRYIRYADGSEELYDHSVDGHEWTNIAADPANAAIKANHARWLPKVNVTGAKKKQP